MHENEWGCMPCQWPCQRVTISIAWCTWHWAISSSQDQTDRQKGTVHNSDCRKPHMHSACGVCLPDDTKDTSNS